MGIALACWKQWSGIPVVKIATFARDRGMGTWSCEHGLFLSSTYRFHLFQEHSYFD